MGSAPRTRCVNLTAHEVRAALAGRLTQLRRVAPFSNAPGDEPNVVVEPWPGEWIAWWTDKEPAEVLRFSRQVYKPGDGIVSPFGRPGDRLVGREAWSPDHACFYPNFPVVYQADYGLWPVNGQVYSSESKVWFPFRWRSPVTMPRRHSRLSFTVLTVRAQRVQEATEADALAEGFLPTLTDSWRKAGERVVQITAAENFAAHWDALHGPGAWERNDWTWVARVEGGRA